jgi:hypothetical protein
LIVGQEGGEAIGETWRERMPGFMETAPMDGLYPALAAKSIGRAQAAIAGVRAQSVPAGSGEVRSGRVDLDEKFSKNMEVHSFHRTGPNSVHLAFQCIDVYGLRDVDFNCR